MEFLQALMTKWRRETKTEPNLKRMERAHKYLKRHGLEPRDVRFENHPDPQWNVRQIRADNEKRAECIGYTNAKTATDGSWQTATRWWIVPKAAKAA